MPAPQTQRSMPFGVPSAAAIADPATRASIEALIANMQVLMGVSGDRDRWAVTRGELVKSGSHGNDDIGSLASVNAGATRLASGQSGAASVTHASGASSVGVGVTIAGDIATVTVTVVPARVYLLRAWLADDAAGTIPTLTFPDTSLDISWWPVTNAAGVWTVNIEHTGVYTWYFHAAPISVTIGSAGVAMT